MNHLNYPPHSDIIITNRSGNMSRKKKETRGRKPLDLTPKKKQEYIAERNKEWKKENMTSKSFRFLNESDADILEKLENVKNATSNTTDYIRKLIRADIEKNGM